MHSVLLFSASSSRSERIHPSIKLTVPVIGSIAFDEKRSDLMHRTRRGLRVFILGPEISRSLLPVVTTLILIFSPLLFCQRLFYTQEQQIDSSFTRVQSSILNHNCNVITMRPSLPLTWIWAGPPHYLPGTSGINPAYSVSAWALKVSNIPQRHNIRIYKSTPSTHYMITLDIVVKQSCSSRIRSVQAILLLRGERQRARSHR